MQERIYRKRIKKAKREKEIKTKETKVKSSSAKITPTAGAMDAFNKEEQELLHVISENISHLTETDQLEEASHILGSLSNQEKVAV